MRISVFSTITDPLERLDPVMQSVGSYAFADEVVLVDGSDKPIDGGGMHEIQDQALIMRNHLWPKEFEWKFIGEQFQRGYEESTGDWVIHADLDYIFHEKDWDAIRQAFKDNPNAPALSFWKYQFLIADRYTLKSRLVIAVNKGKFGDRIKFNGGGDLCQPTLDGKDLRPDEVPEARIPFYNYDFLLKTKDIVKKDFGRFARAWGKHKGYYEWGGPDDESAFEYFLKMQIGRFNSREHKILDLRDHPTSIQQTLANLVPENFGYNGWGFLPVNSYANLLYREG